ncbi:MAG TPA: 3'-5' exonuclease, partial [Chthoniobacterales bacterium]|nr:3'-5' exonuclease [Chthoniobacterales bacterium]
PGQVIRVPFTAALLPAGEKTKDYKKAAIEARELASWIKETGLENLRAASWRDVAILCPRKLWLRTMATALRRVGLPAAIQSESDLKGDNPAYAWLTALCTIMSDPRNSYEIAGVLREVFGIADHDLAIFAEGNGARFRIDEQQKAAGVVSSPLRLLAETRRDIEGRALFDAIDLLVEQTQLRERLRVLPTEDFPDLEQELDWLIALAAEAEADGATLTDFAEKLRADYLKQRDVRLAANEGIQLITAQKAKGSEWQAVILPFLARGIVPPSPRYPCLLKVPNAREPLVALTKEDFDEEGRALNKIAAQQEAARLLYVAATRARHTLVLAYDKELFLDSKNSIPPTAQLKHFGNNEAALFAQYETSAEFDVTTLAARADSAPKSDLVAAFPTLTQKERQQSLRRAEGFVHKFNPSGYDEEIALALDQPDQVATAWPSRSGRSREDTPATLYGSWWHSLFQEIPWTDGIAAADAVFQRYLPSSPDQRRSAVEWKLVRENLSGESALAEFLRLESARVHAEFPFLWSLDRRACVEGVIDLLVVDESRNRCLLVDWKTNRIKEGEEADLRQRYRPQIAAYWKAVREIASYQVEAGIFATALGQFMPYGADDLAAEWERLRVLPPRELSSIAASL